MKEIVAIRQAVNIEALDATLRAALGDAFVGVSTRRGEVIAYLADTAAPVHADQARAILEGHDPTVLTPEQKERADRLAVLDQMRRLHRAPIDPQDFAGQPVLLRLAERLAWLEREIRDLREL